MNVLFCRGPDQHGATRMAPRIARGGMAALVLAMAALLPVAGRAGDATATPAADADRVRKAHDAAARANKLLAAALALVPPAGNAPTGLLFRAGDALVAMGDSITSEGCGPCEYLRDAEAVLVRQYPTNQSIRFINAGTGGNKVENLLARFERDVLARKPAGLTINIGINDVWGQPEGRLEKPHDEKNLKAYQEGLAKMVRQARAAGIQVVLLSPTIIQEDPQSEGNRRLLLYVTAMRQVAADHACAFVDLHSMFLAALQKKPAHAKPYWLTYDGVHMSPLGGAVMAVGLLRALGVPDEQIVTPEQK